MRGLPTGVTRSVDVGEVRRAIAVRRVMDARDHDRERSASDLYELLRTMTDAELVELCGFTAPRQQMIADLIERNVRGQP